MEVLSPSLYLSLSFIITTWVIPQQRDPSSEKCMVGADVHKLYVETYLTEHVCPCL